MEVPQLPMPQSDLNHIVHCQVRSAALVHEIERERVEVAPKILKWKGGVVRLQPWVAHVKNGHDAVMRDVCFTKNGLHNRPSTTKHESWPERRTLLPSMT